MSSDYGVLSEAVPAGVALVAATAALAATWTGRSRWEPPNEDLPSYTHKITGVLSAIGAGCLWFWFTRLHPSTGGELLTVVGGMAVAAVLGSAAMIWLHTCFVYRVVKGVSKGKPVEDKLIGGFRLTDEAKAALAEHKVTVQELLKGAAYDPDKLWPRGSRAIAKMLFHAAYVLVVGGFTLALTGAGILVGPSPAKPPQPTAVVAPDAALRRTMEAWLVESTKARTNPTVLASATLPSDLVAARTAFETEWQATGLAVRRAVDQSKLHTALSRVNRLYRIQEGDSPTQRNAMYWADEAIQHFEQTQNRKALAGVLLDKAAIYLSLGQIGHANQADFQRIAREGDAVMAKAIELAEGEEKANALRMASRFFYDLARPASFRLAEPWDNNYLLLARDKVLEAKKLSPEDIKNDNQLLRATGRIARNKPQDTDPEWGKRLRDAQMAMKAAWDKREPELKGRDQRLSPLSVLGTGTVEAVARVWRDAPKAERAGMAKQLLVELEDYGLKLLREADSLRVNSELKNSYPFDIRYDIARGQVQRVLMLRATKSPQADAVFAEVLANLGEARRNAKATQLDSAYLEAQRDPLFQGLMAGERSRIMGILKGPAS